MNNLTLKKRLSLGYAIIGSIALLVIVMSYLLYSETITDFKNFSHLSKDAQTELQLTANVRELQRQAMLYTFGGHDAAVNGVTKYYNESLALIDQILEGPHLEKENAKISEIKRHLDNYFSAFSQVIEQRELKTRLVEVNFRNNANTVESEINQILASDNIVDANIKLNLKIIQNELLLVEKNAFRYFDTLDTGYIEEVKSNVDKALIEIDQLTTKLRGENKGLLLKVKEGVSIYETSFLEAVQRTRGYLYLVNVVMAAEANEILYLTDKLSNELVNRMDFIESMLQGKLASSLRDLGIISMVLFLVIVLSSLTISRSITKPILSLANTFRRLSEGSLALNIPEYKVQDEVGELTKAAKIFLEKNIELESSKKELLRAKDEADAANQAKSLFLANMSHEIRTPLNAIVGFTNVLLNKEKETKKREYLHRVKHSSDTLLGVINDILDFSKIESGKFDIDPIDFNVTKEIEAVIELFLDRAQQKNIDLLYSFKKEIPELLHGDILRIKQVLINLLSNAVKFSTVGGKIKVEMEYDNKKQILRIDVSDTGIGIEYSKLDMIFRVFEQADSSTTRQYGGTGLGLAISKHLCELMGGGLNVESELGKGSTFSVSLNLAPVTRLSRKSETSDQALQQRNLADGNVLVVEDNENNQMLLRILLEKMGLKVDTANDGEEGVEYFTQYEYDLVFMDENMPNLTGLEATKKIIQFEQITERSHTPIIAVTANALAGDRERFLANGMDDYIPKPITVDSLQRVVEQWMPAKHNDEANQLDWSI